MTDDIPDDVVERALAEWFRMPASEARYLPYAHTMRAALRVAVEWEREQCARVAEQCHFDEDDPRNDDRDRAYAQARRHAAKDIRALKEKQG